MSTVNPANVRKLVATSHGHRYTYWLFSDHYIYQFDVILNTWIGWFCSEPSWERTFSKVDWMDVV